MNVITEDILMHYGMPRRSGRYPWGSGDNPYQRSRDFLGRVSELKKSGLSEREIAKELSILNEKGEPSTTKLRAYIGVASYERRLYDVQTAKSLRADGLGPTEIGRRMGINESTVRSLLNPNSEAKMNAAMGTANYLREQAEKKGMLDVGDGVERELGISKEKLNQALVMLEDEGYKVRSGGIPQPTNPGQQTTQRVLLPPGYEHKDIYNYDQVHSVTDYTSHDDGKTFTKFQYPSNLDSKRLMIRYSEDGGQLKDGIVELRRGVDDLSLGGDHYAQVRILVDNKKYIKGMAVYGDDKDFPPGVDVIFNTNKSKDVAKLDVLKDIKNDPDNPFGSLIKANGQSTYIDKNGKEKLSLINKRASEGDWSDWADAVPSQFLAKQSRPMAKKQLDLAKQDKMKEFKELCELNNPVIKKHLLQKFSDECDSAAVHLKAAALPGQKYHVIIPINSLKDTEIYAPRYENGTKLALIRYPHGGLFEIPILTVNNKHAQARKLLPPDVEDAVGINSKIAEQLSGADFDGDTVMCIPTHDPRGNVKIASRPPLKELEGFDPKMEYAERPGMKYMKDPKTGKDATQAEMGKISNLITDMTLAGASDRELADAVRHSMVVIDAAKHKLDYKRSEVEHNISALKKKYQAKVDEDGNVHYGGASTLISRAKGQATVDKRQGTPKINIKGEDWYDPSKPEGSYIYKKADDLYYPDRSYNKTTKTVTLRTLSGKKITYNVDNRDAYEKYNPIKKVDPNTGEVTYTNKAGDISYRVKTRTQKSTQMAETDDAYSLVSPAKHPMELIYADYANSMKDLANKARIEMVNTGNLKQSKSAKETYKTEVQSLNSKLNEALLNRGREREAIRRTNAEIQAKKEADSTLKTADIKKASQIALTKHRQEVGSIARRDRNIVITDREWEAIQAGAVSENKLKQILNNADTDKLRERATPRSSTTISTAQASRIKAYKANGLTISEIAKAIGVSSSTVSKYLKGVS